MNRNHGIPLVSLLLLVAIPAVGIAAFFCGWSATIFYLCAAVTLLGSLGEWVTDKISFICAVVCVVLCIVIMRESIVAEITLGVMAASIASELFGFLRRTTS